MASSLTILERISKITIWKKQNSMGLEKIDINVQFVHKGKYLKRYKMSNLIFTRKVEMESRIQFRKGYGFLDEISKVSLVISICILSEENISSQ